MMLSIVTAVCNEEKNVLELYSELRKSVFLNHLDYELIFVDDGSTDKTADLVKELIERDPNVQLISLSRNWGHQIALSAGLDHSIGDLVITMDGDLQHPPNLIPEMVRWAQEREIDVLHMVKKEDKGRRLSHSIFAKVFYRLFNRISDIEIEEQSSDFRLYSRRVVEILKQMKERDRVLRGLSSWVGFKQDKMPYSVCLRHGGKATYNVRKLFKLALLGMFSFTSFPVRIATFLGFIMTVSGLMLLGVTIYRNMFSNVRISGESIIITLSLFLFGFLFMLLGMVSEYIYRIFIEVKKRPLYVVKEIVSKNSYERVESTL